MTFLNPFFLWALPLLSLPVVLHLIHKRPPRKLPFSYTPWLKAVHQAAMPRKKLRELLLLILRTLLLLFLVLFFSRPVLTTGGSLTGKSDNSSIVFLIDVSASMGARTAGRTALDVVLDELPALLRQIPSDTRLGYLAYSNQVEGELSPTQERTRFLASLKNLKVAPRPTDIAPALEMAMKMLANQPNGRKSLVIFSDHAENGYASLLKKEGFIADYDPEVNIVAWEAVPESSNAGIESASLSLTGEGLLKGGFRATQFGEKSAPPSWSLKLNEHTVGQGVLERSGPEGNMVPLQAQLPEGGFYSGKLELTPDSLSFDDVYYLAGRVPKGFRLLMVDGESGLAPSDSEVYYLKLALESPRDPRLQAMTVIRPESLKDQNLGQYDAVVLANTGELDEKSQESLTSWVQEGGGIFVAAGSKWPKSPQSPLNILRTRDIDKTKTKLAPPDPGSELSNLPGLEEFEWSEVDVTSLRPADQLSGATVLIKAENGSPVLLRRLIGKGTALIWMSSIDREWTNFPAKPLFAPLMRELIASLADPLREQTSLTGFVGQPLRIRMPAGARAATVIDPDGKSSGGRVGEDGVLNWSAPSLPGLYRVQMSGVSHDFSFAINIPDLGGEGNPKRIKAGQLRSFFPKSSVTWISAGGKSGENALAALQGRDLTRMLAWLLALILIVETILASFKGGFLFRKEAAVLAFLLFSSLIPVRAGDGNDFVYAQLKHSGAWDPYPSVHNGIFEMIRTMTNIPFRAERKIVTMSDPAVFESAFLVIKGNSELQFSAAEKSNLKKYIDGGGFVFIDDTLANPRSPFAASIRSLFAELYPDRPFERLTSDHAVFRSFFLLRGIGGRRVAAKYLEGLEVGGRSGGEGRTAVLYCANDLLGTWMRDNVGEYTFSCEPGGEPQRWESFKLTLNIIYFSLTGTYKRDAIHQPFIEKKLGL